MTAAQRRIGIIKPCCIGDAVMALPVIDNILNADPSAEIEVWCGRHVSPVFKAHPGVDSIIEIPDVPTARDFPALVRKLRTSRDSGMLLLDRSRLLTLACRVSGVGVLGSVRCAPGSLDHEVDGYLYAVKQAGFDVTVRRPALQIDRPDLDRAQEKVGSMGDRCVVLHPGGAQNPGTIMHAKRWPPANWHEVIHWLEANSVEVLLTGGADEVEHCMAVAAGSQARIAAGKLTLMESAALISAADAYVGPDTGLSHLAAATGVPTIVIFGPTNPNQYAPRGRHVTVLAAPGSTEISDIDLRKNERAGLPSTSEISAQAVIEVLSQQLVQRGEASC